MEIPKGCDILSEFLCYKIIPSHLWNISNMPKVSILFSSNAFTDLYSLLETC